MELKDLIERGIERSGSAREFAKRVGLAEQAISNYRNGIKACGIEMHARIANAAGLSDTQVRDYVWGVLKERLGKLAEKAVVVMLFGACISIGFAQPAAAAGPEIDNV